MTPAEAVALWDALEQKLVRIGLPEDGRLMRLRAELIRTIAGETDETGRSTGTTRPSKSDAIRGQRRRVGDRNTEAQRLLDPQGGVGPADGSGRAAQGRANQASPDFRRTRSGEALTAEIVRRSTEIYDPKWAAMIERACMGYSGDDEVTYGS